MKEQILVIDIGNTNTVFGVYAGDELVFHKRTVTHRDRTSDDLGLYLKGFLRESDISAENIRGAIYSSVVPQTNPITDRMLQDWIRVKPLRVTVESKLPFSIKYPRPYEIGADRLVNTAAVIKKGIKKCIIIDLGTATTFCVINDEPSYLGGVIAPGLKLSMDALTKNTAQLPPIIFHPPEKILGDSTISSLQSGFFYGWVGLLENIISEIRKEYGQDYQVVATGGLVNSIDQAKPGIFNIIDPALTLDGLKYLYELNH